MTEIPALLDLPEGFDGKVRLFPLPGLVAFPHVVQPLRIFEPRYCDMLTEALATDQLITLATLDPGWEYVNQAVPKIHQAACICRVLVHTPRTDGTHNVLLLGIRRCIILEEEKSTKPFRVAQVKILDEICRSEPAIEMGLKKKLLKLFGEYVSAPQLMQHNLSQLADELLTLGPVTDLVAFGAALSTDDKLRLLADADVVQRASKLINLLETTPEMRTEDPQEDPSGRFPPPFSLN